METVLGLDLGTNSVGWAVVQTSDLDDRSDFHFGVYVFPEGAEEDGGLRVSERAKRGQIRRQRKQLRRKRDRMRRVLRLLLNNGLLPADPEERANLMSADRQGAGRPHHPFILRKRGLDEPLTLHQFGRCVHHIARRRGYLSTRDLIARFYERRLGQVAARVANLDDDPVDIEGEDTPRTDEAKERSALLRRLKEVRAMIEKGNARTVGELCADRLLDPEVGRAGVRARGKRKKGRLDKKDPGWRTDRMLYEEEFEQLWDSQARFHPELRGNRLRDALRHAIFYQRPLMSKQGLIGPCEFMPNRRRMPRASLLAQRCSILQDLLNLKVSLGPGLPERRLTPGEIRPIAAELELKASLKWNEIRQVAGLPEQARFSAEPATAPARAGKGQSTRSRTSITGNRTMTAMRTALGEERWNAFSSSQQEEITHRMIHAFYPHNVIAGLVREFGLTVDEVRAISGVHLPQGYSNHCRAVWARLEPHMRNGLVYSEACEAAGYRQPGQSTEPVIERPLDRLGGLPDLRNPVVQRSTSMAFKVINAVIDRFGKPDRIRIEMPRDVSRTNHEREQLWKRQEEQKRDRDCARTHLIENGHKPTDENIRKVLLWTEANQRCPYEPTTIVSLAELMESYEIDHIIPRSRSFDDSLINKTICPRGLNLQKGDRTPYEWLGHTDRWGEIEAYLAGEISMPAAKRDRIKSKECDTEDFTNRALSDTRYISRVILREVGKLGVPVDVSQGRMTAALRRAWQLEGCIEESEAEKKTLEQWREQAVKKRSKPRYDHRHHGIDALVTALTDRRTLQSLSTWFKTKESRGSYREAPTPKPWPTIREDVAARVPTMPVAFAPQRRLRDGINKDTALRPPDPALVRAALAALPLARRGRPRKAVVVGSQLVRVAPDGTPLAAYELGNNHHAVIWEKVDARGNRKRQITVVSMHEAYRRKAEGIPVFDRTPFEEGWTCVMALCKDDIVEWTGDRPGLYRVAKFSRGDGFFEIRLRQIIDAREIKETQRRVQGQTDLFHIRARIIQGPLGNEIGREPSRGDGR